MMANRDARRRLRGKKVRRRARMSPEEFAAVLRGFEDLGYSPEFPAADACRRVWLHVDDGRRLVVSHAPGCPHPAAKVLIEMGRG